MFLPFPFYNSRPNFYNPDGERQNETTEIGFHGREKVVVIGDGFVDG